MKKIIYTLVFFVSMILIMPKANALEIEVTSEDELRTCVGNETATCTIAVQEIELAKTIKVTANSDIIVDLNGNKIIGPDDGQSNYYAFIVDGGKLTLKDSSENKTGEIDAKCYGIETKSGTFIMESGKITATNNSTFGAAVVNYGGKVEVRGGILLAYHWAVDTEAFFSNAETIITGGTFEVISDEDYAVQAGGDYSPGTQGNPNGQYSESVSINGGTIKGENGFGVVSNATVSITGGTFDMDVTNYIEDGFEITEDENGNYIVSKINFNSNVPGNPQTYDDIINYIALAFISLIILMFAVKKVFN